MDKLADKIYDAYYSEKDTQFKKKVRERVHWVCANTLGKEILDIGCSQGITAMILGREGKNVLGIDLSESAVTDANLYLSKEEKETQNCVKFEKANFMLKEFDKTYDTIILGEVLEHITDIQSFFNKAITHLNENGKIIVTTPFGINDFPDHKRTFYIKDFIEFQTTDVSITNIKFFGKWIGVIYTKDFQLENINVDKNLLEEFEQAVYYLEREAINNQNKLKKQLNNNQVINNNEDEIKWKNEVAEYKELFEKEKIEKITLQKQLVEQYEKEEKILKEYKQLLINVDALRKNYNNLKNSKLGKVTTKYWKYKNQKRSK